MRSTDGEEKVKKREIAGEFHAGDERSYDNVTKRVSDETNLGWRRRHVRDVFKYFCEKAVSHEVEITESVSLVGLCHEKVESHMRESEVEVDPIEAEIKLIPLEAMYTDD